MKYVIHGATNGTNYGDCLLASLFYKHLTEKYPNDQFVFAEIPKYGIGKFFRDNIGYTQKEHYFNYKQCDGLIYFSGGYWGEYKSSFLRSLKRYYRYFLPGMWFVAHKRPIAVIGVGGGPINSSLLRKRMTKILNHSSVICVRDIETEKYFKEWGVTKDIITTTDTAMLMPFVASTGNKQIFVHIEESEEYYMFLKNIVCPAINRYLEKHKEYKIVVGHDQIANDRALKFAYDNFNTKRKEIYSYSDMLGFERIIAESSLILTPKLHAGIIAVAMGRAVIACPLHTEKIRRFYKQISSVDRCIPVTKLTENSLNDLLNKYCDSIIDCSKKKELAKMNFKLLDEFIEKNDYCAVQRQG